MLLRKIDNADKFTKAWATFCRGRMMLRGAFVVLTAVGVLWHTVAGCCAHHVHAPILASGSTSVVNTAHPQCCGHVDRCGSKKFADARAEGVRAATNSQNAPVTPTKPCLPYKCSECACAFAASPNSPTIDYPLLTHCWLFAPPPVISLSQARAHLGGPSQVNFSLLSQRGPSALCALLL